VSSDFDNEEEGSPGQERWMVSFADFITLMFAVFAVLYATSTKDIEKTKEFQESIKRYLIKTGAFGGTGDKINQGEKYTNPIEPPIQTFNQANPLSREAFDEAEKYLEEELTEAERKKYVLDVSLEELGVRLILTGPLIYAPHSTKFREEAVPFLEKLGGLLSRLGRRVLVEGHYSESSALPSVYPSAWEFSGARATALVRYLVKRHKMGPTMFMPVSYGGSRPIEKGNAPHDRVELVILTEDLPF
jgi:chemotaxis protein MotB